MSFFSCSNNIDSTEKLVTAISERYNGKWFKQIRFMQTTNFYDADTIYKSERWAEEYVYPGQLIIKVNGETDSKSGYLYRNDSVYYLRNNEIMYAHQITHDLVILSMDIYNMKPDEAMLRFSQLDYDLNKFDTRTYNGRKIYVVGAESGDTLSNQVWFDAEHLYFVKMIKNSEEGYHEVVFNDYINVNGSAWIEQEIIFKLDGKVYMIEKYFDISIPDEKKTEIKVSDFKNFNIRLLNPVELLPDINYFNNLRYFMMYYIIS
jgi:hypothetical protein